MKTLQHGFEWTHRENTNDLNIAHEVFNIKMYDLTPFKNINTIVDIGAHIGSFTVKAKLTYPNAKIYSYEPIAGNFEMLKANTSKFPDVKIFNTTVSGDRLPGRLMESNATNTGLNIFEYGKEPTYPNTHIKQIQDMVGHIDLLKIDCEGGENSIFENMDFSKVGIIIAELHQYGATKSVIETFQMLEDKGFKALYQIIINGSIAEYVGIKQI